ncbi:hypothetical protein QN372_00715 [Undibacterium sp. RTI2.1]|uniref:hypothetical protein n=1 Tax=unclassified Undibacterium TaxID=2630295 RepID=UPI002AB4DE8C|nr:MULTISPECIES: hypothetical protein [unclassified Undibacterium]MDY7537658.1 hypothetical protein [Undibacterium sp. 5I1]MEB0029260.1 hypothetical protein [Undibacterium sp. RTI2.1]MEB0115568.1 hypothetical protein [Undibacterium sp. RTI2.2]MEB0256395.1 hypothetical protein [Undibacterium sp. 5I1]
MDFLRKAGTGIFGVLTLFSLKVILDGQLFLGITEVIVFGALGIWCFIPLAKKIKLEKQQEALMIQDIQMKRDQQLFKIKNGELPVVSVKSVILRSGETAHLSSRGAILMEEQVTGYEAGTTSVRVNIAKGVTVGKAGTKAKAVKGYVGVSKGEFALTSGRVVFAGEIKSFEIPYSKLTSFFTIEDGITFHVGSKSHMVCLPRPDVPFASLLLEKLTQA